MSAVPALVGVSEGVSGAAEAADAAEEACPFVCAAVPRDVSRRGRFASCEETDDWRRLWDVDGDEVRGEGGSFAGGSGSGITTAEATVLLGSLACD